MGQSGSTAGLGEEIVNEGELSQFLSSEGGRIQLRIPDRVLPEFLISANNAASAGRIAEAETLLSDENLRLVERIADRRRPGVDLVYLVLAMVLQKIAHLKEAARWYEKILERQRHPLVLNELAVLCHGLGHHSQAVRYRREAMEASPDDIGIRGNYAVDLMVDGRIEEGIDLLRAVVEQNPADPVLHSNLLWYTHYLLHQDRESHFEEHKRWAAMHAPPEPARTSHPNSPDPDRRLRVGYISPDFRMHSAAYNFEPVLDGRDPQRVEIYGYGNIARPDGVTDRLKSKFDHYRSIRGLDDREVVRMVERDRIDILVAVAGHAGDNRLPVLAYKPAPIQVDYQGVSTTGMQQVDYRFTDSLLDPPGSEKFYVEASVYLPGGVHCYRPPDFAPPVVPLPAERAGHITFGSFNGTLKSNPYVASLWAEVLKNVPGSHLLIKFQGGGDQEMRERYLERFRQLQISPGRVEIHGWKSPVEHLKLYGRVDVALDTYPFNGCVTTLEGMWMGVPTITLVGESLISRAGLSILSRVGLEFFAASTAEEYVAKATALAQNRSALAKIRASMRQRVTASTLCNAKAHAAGLEAAYRKMWHRWCRSRTADGSDLTVKGLQRKGPAHECTRQRPNLRGRRIFISTMPRSGSAWICNVTRALIQAAGLEAVPKSTSTGDEAQYLIKAFSRHPIGQNQVYCVKTHAILKVKKADDILIITAYRDVRDCVVSFMRFVRANFEQAIRAAPDWMRLADAYSANREDSILKIRYDEIVHQPLDTIRKIDTFIGTDVGDESIEEINERFSRENVERRIGGINSVSVEYCQEDPSAFETVANADGTVRVREKSTGFQTNHITSKKDGQWRDVLTEEQQRILMRETSAWLERYGFPL